MKTSSMNSSKTGFAEHMARKRGSDQSVQPKGLPSQNNATTRSKQAQSLGPPNASAYSKQRRLIVPLETTPDDDAALDSPLANTTQFQAIPDSEYKHLLDPYGIEMHQQQMVKKETQRELLQMQNRIKLLQMQEQRIKRQNDMRLKKVHDIVELRRRTKVEREKREQRKLQEAAELEQRRRRF